jgi:hypothetical protein
VAYHSPTFVTVNDNLTSFNATYVDGTGVSPHASKRFVALHVTVKAASGFIARETVQLSDLIVANQAFGESSSSSSPKLISPAPGLITVSNLTMDDQISGILGLGFPRLSAISSSIQNGIYNRADIIYLPHYQYE